MISRSCLLVSYSLKLQRASPNEFAVVNIELTPESTYILRELEIVLQRDGVVYISQNILQNKLILFVLEYSET